MQITKIAEKLGLNPADFTNENAEAMILAGIDASLELARKPAKDEEDDPDEEEPDDDEDDEDEDEDEEGDDDSELEEDEDDECKDGKKGCKALSLSADALVQDASRRAEQLAAFRQRAAQSR